MKSYLKLFNLKGKPVTVSYWFLLLFLFFSPLTTLGIFISILLHEIAHALMADKKGYTLHGINIGLFEGSTTFDRAHDKDLMLISFVGPLTNLILFGIFYGLNFLYPVNFIKDLYSINLLLFIFNILPIYPMDGGAILRSFANLKEDRYKARKITDVISLLFSILLVLIALITKFFILAIFSAYFIYLSINELKK